MGRPFLLALLVAGVLLQGVAAASTDWLPETNVSSHCAGSEPAPDHGDCCDSSMSNACAVHCQVAEAPVALVLPERGALPTFAPAAHDRANPNPDYSPDLRPPIA